MREMKDSGLPWAGNIPGTWNIKKGKFFLNIQLLPVRADDGVITCFRDGEVTLRSNRREEGFTISNTEAGYQGINQGDLIVHGMDGFAGAIGISDSRGKATPVLNNLATHENKRYLMYELRAMAFCELFQALSTGIRVRTCDTNWGKLRSIEYLLPPAEEQHTIVAFLDSKCAEIDALSAEIQSEIETLESYKRSVITEAVTRGLEKNVPMKDSGTQWCPLIPAHWIRTNPKALFSQRFDRAYLGERQLTASQEHGIVYQDEFMEMTGNRVVTVIKDFSILKHVEPGDFVISMRSFQGGLEYSELRGCISSAYVMLIPNKELVYPPFFRWFFKSSKYINAIQSTSNLVRDGQAMRYANFAQVPLFIIPKEEQKQIADYLDNHITEANAIIQTKQEQLAVLADYKKSIIFEYVTGKKEVPVA